MQQTRNILQNGKNLLFLSSVGVRVRTIFHFDIFLFALAAGFTWGLFLFLKLKICRVCASFCSKGSMILLSMKWTKIQCLFISGIMRQTLQGWTLLLYWGAKNSGNYKDGLRISSTNSLPINLEAAGPDLSQNRFKGDLSFNVLNEVFGCNIIQLQPRPTFLGSVQQVIRGHVGCLSLRGKGANIFRDPPSETFHR